MIVNEIKEKNYLYFMEEVKLYQIYWSMNNKEFISQIIINSDLTNQIVVSDEHYKKNRYGNYKPARNCDIGKKDVINEIKQQLVSEFLKFKELD